MNATLAARVKAVNRANAYAHSLFERLSDVFRPLVSETVLKVDGQFLKRVQALMPDLPHGHDLMVYRYTSDYSLMWVVKTCESVAAKEHVVYHETSVCVGKISGAVLTELYDSFGARTDYEASEVEAARERYAAAKKAADDALSALHPFGEYDR